MQRVGNPVRGLLLPVDPTVHVVENLPLGLLLFILIELVEKLHCQREMVTRLLHRLARFDELALKNLENPLAPADIARVILRAATDRRPKERYYAPFSARLQSVFLGLLPSRLLDSILRRVYKIEKS